jgi:transcriptional regulator with XRE-family HTH domain
VDSPEIKIYLHKRRLEIGQRVKEVRRLNNCSQQDIAHYLGCSRIRVNRAENGVSEFSVGELELLARLFDVTILHFLGVSLAISIGGDDKKYMISV